MKFVNKILGFLFGTGTNKIPGEDDNGYCLYIAILGVVLMLLAIAVVVR